MKRLILSAILLISASTIANAKAKIPVCFPCEYIQTTVDLPAETEFIGESDDPLNVGYRYEQINILWVPLWNYEGSYCLVNDAEDTYYDLTEEEKIFLTENHEASFEGNPLGLWDKMGGKAIIAVILLFVVWGYLPSKKKEGETNNESDTTT